MEHILRLGPLNDPIERQQAPALQRILIAISSASIIAIVIFLLTLGTTPAGIVLVSGAALITFTSTTGVAALWYGRFQLAVLVTTLGLVLAVLLVALIYGYPAATPFLVVTLVPILLAGLVSRTRLLIFIASLSGLISILTLALKSIMAPLTAMAAPTSDLTLITIAVFVLVIIVTVTILALFGPALRQALLAALAREHDLEQLRDSLEKMVAERTSSLHQALTTVEKREAEMRQTLDELRASQELVRELSAPIIPILPGVLIAPLVGAIDSARADILTMNVLQMIERQRARAVIFDVTGVPIVDTQVARIFIHAATSAQLLGAQTMLVGIRPEVAQTLVGLGVTLDQFIIYADLQQAITTLIDKPERAAG